ncbi:hypothetical protein [Streptomyces enissocaesilis]|uniref:hypothetical protein n=1 Tax=Streptomyces enissocaesilis TaxID=332589 RepID=UPI0031D44676
MRDDDDLVRVLVHDAPRIGGPHGPAGPGARLHQPRQLRARPLDPAREAVRTGVSVRAPALLK